jgi:hypothetical protein
VASSHAAACTAPADYGDLFIEYGGEIRSMVRTQLGLVAQPGDVDDGVQYILGQFIKNDVIAQFQPGYINDYNHKPTTFGAFIKNKVALYCKGLREALSRNAGRELQVLDHADPEAAYALDVIGAVTDEYPSLAGGGMDRLREKLAGHASPDGEGVLPLFEALAGRFEQGQSVSAAFVRRQFGKTRAEADAWFESLKDALRDVPAEVPESPPEPEVTEAQEAAVWFAGLGIAVDGGYLLGGLVLSAYEVRAAADALKLSNGNQVLRAFKDFSHRLAGSGKTWYLAFAEQVMRAHPELRNPPMRHRDGHFGRVKRALIWGLEELVGDEPEVMPAPKPAPVAEAVTEPVGAPVSEPALRPVLPPDESQALWADLERAIARLPGFGDGNLEAAVEAVRLLSLAPA